MVSVKKQAHKGIKLNNSSATQAVVNIVGCKDQGSRNAILLGGYQSVFREVIEATRRRFVFDAIDWWCSWFID
ncbi:hypothetical protein ACI09M_003752 [Cronobacter dublinensis]